MVIPASIYEYAPLPEHSAESHITRILRLLPDESVSSPIRCELEVVSLDENPSYEAISYCWGTPLQFDPIHCNGQPLDVSPNLTASLRHLRRPDSSRMLWADAICISQDDVLERSQQVQMMQNIFEGAERVLVWLGEADAHSRLAIRLLEAVERARQRLPAAVNAGNITLGELCKHGLSAELLRQGEYSLKKLLWRPWFRRVWVIQEVAVARQVTLHCGHESIDWDAFVAALRALDAANVLTIQSTVNFDGLGFPDVIDFARTGYQSAPPWPREQPPELNGPYVSPLDARRPDAVLFTTINFTGFDGALSFSLWFRKMSATDPRDKLFAIRGLTERSAHPMRLAVDYTKGVRTVYHEFAVSTISTMQTLDILSTPRCHTQMATALPSWVPDWSDVGTVALVGQLSSRFQASKNSRHNARFLHGQSVLVVEGDFIDQIARTGLALDYAPKAGDPSYVKGWWSIYDSITATARYQTVLADWERLAHASGSGGYITGEAMGTVYTRTLTANYRRRQETTTAYRRWQQDNWPMRLLARWNLDSYAPLVWLTAALHLAITLCHDAHFGLGHMLQVAQFSPQRSYAPALFYRRPFERYLTMALGRRLARTEKGYLALVPAEAKVGDAVALVKGGRTPLILRSGGDSWELIGDSYIHGIMSGEAFNEATCRDIHLV